MVDQYIDLHEDELEIKRQYESLVNNYYDLATTFYEFGWGKSFHFAPRKRGESLEDSLLRHQRFLGNKLSLKEGLKVIDLGCGVGGPMTNLARWYDGSDFVGLNNNANQVERARKYAEDIQDRCRFIHANYMEIPEENESYDVAYAIESMPHAPDKTAAFREAWRILRPGGLFAGYDWCVTEDFIPTDEEHIRIKRGIMLGNGLPDISLTDEVCTALKDAGFDLLESRDVALDADPETPWYRALQGRDFKLSSIPRTPVGRTLTNLTLRIAEGLRLVPEGSRAVSTFLNIGADALVAGGKSGLFTPMFFFLARKPE